MNDLRRIGHWCKLLKRRDYFQNAPASAETGATGASDGQPAVGIIGAKRGVRIESAQRD
ncbi:MULTISPECIES: hypothetical protein [Ensifer]|uniref:hypothetical protein n=1 Tax=Ensifer TaxID=106591 RepID=UPI00159EEEE8|nr:hypothetical protein [Ensifer adhaerens]